MVWFQESIPRHSFFSWLAILDRLSTRARQHKIIPTILVDCLFCGGEESSDHLCFACQITLQVWMLIVSNLPKLQGARLSWPQFMIWSSSHLRRRTKVNIEAKLF